MKFCPNCGNQINDNAVFCPNCGTKTGAAAAPESNQAAGGAPAQETPSGGTYQAGGNSGEYAAGATPGNPGGTYQAGPQGYPGAPPSAQPGPQSYQSVPQNYQVGTSGFQPGPPNYPPNRSGGAGSNKLLIVIIAVIVGLGLIGGGIFVYSKLAGKNHDPGLSNNGGQSGHNTNDAIDDDNGDEDIANITDDAGVTHDAAVTDHTGPGVDDNYEFGDNGVGGDFNFGNSGTTGSDSYDSYDGYDDNNDYTDYTYAGVDDFLAGFDTATASDIQFAFDDIGMDSAAAYDFYYYGEWFNGYVYSFEYQGSVIDLFLNYDETVFSVETAGVQVYLAGYGSYAIDDFLGETTHYDESFPDDGYVFVLSDTNVSSYISMTTSPGFDYVVQLLDAYDGSMVMAFYIYGGNTAGDWGMAVPPGDYTIEYAAGSTWYGVNDLFGPDTIYYRADDIYSFYDGEETYLTLDIYGGTGIPSTDITSEYS